MIDPRERYAIIPAGLVSDGYMIIDMFASEVVAEDLSSWNDAEARINRLLDEAFGL